jgi:hypothetical protein
MKIIRQTETETIYQLRKIKQIESDIKLLSEVYKECERAKSVEEKYLKTLGYVYYVKDIKGIIIGRIQKGLFYMVREF